MRIQFGLHLLTHGNYSFNLLKELTLKAEEEGFYVATVGDHFYSTTESYLLLNADPTKPDKLDAWTVLAALSSITSRIRLGTCVSPLPLYHPPRLAKIISTLDVISGGRVVFGVGAGWIREEAESYGYVWEDFNTRIEKTKEALKLIVKMWIEDRVTFKGKYYRVVDAPLYPKPIQKPYPKIWFGGAAKQIIKLVGEYGNGWVLASYGKWSKFNFLELFRGKVEEVKSAVKEFKRDPSKIMFIPIVSTESKMGVDKKISEVESLIDAGANLILLYVGVPPSKALSELTYFCREVIPSFK